MKLEYFLPIIIVPWFWCFIRLAKHHQRGDKFIKEIYTNHRDIWESLGQPCGWRWSAPGRIAHPFAMFSFRWEWLRRDPDWLLRAPEMRDRFNELRDGFRQWNYRSMPIMVASALLFFAIAAFMERQ